ncbi:MAG: squalene synthase HpnC [Planctomycetota bacterium]|nr:squalene synthase HpnC [Planctomycetota bacterium]
MSAPQHNRHPQVPSNGGGADSDWADLAKLRRSRLANRRLARSHYENFFITSFFLPRSLHQPFYDIYAFCRTADDLADELSSDQESLNALASMETDLRKALSPVRAEERPERDLFISLSDTIRKFKIEERPFLDLLTAFRMNQIKKTYQSQAELLEYCKLSANPVGRVLLHLAGVKSERAMELSDSICTGLQLVNFLQDIVEDFERGRIYLPQDELKQYSIEITDFRDPSQQRALKLLVKSRSDDVLSYLQKGKDLSNLVPPWFSRTVNLFCAGGFEAVRAIEKNHYDVFTTSPRVSFLRRFWVLGRAANGFW